MATKKATAKAKSKAKTKAKAKAAPKKAARKKKVAPKKKAVLKAKVKSKIKAKAKVKAKAKAKTKTKAKSKVKAKSKTASKKAAPRKTVTKKKATTKKNPPKKAAPKKAAPKKNSVNKAVVKKKAPPKTKPKTASRKKASIPRPANSQLQTDNFTPYAIKRGEEYMNENQKAHFKQILLNWRNELMVEVDRTVHHMQDEAANPPDPADRATLEEEFSIELRTRDRERRLIKKIDSTIEIIANDDYGWCDSCGVEIGIRRLEARPTANKCIDCKTLDEIKEKQLGA